MSSPYGPSLLKTEQTQLPQPFLIKHFLSTLHKPCCPLLDILQDQNILLSPFEVRGPKLNIVLEVPHQCQVQGIGHSPNPVALLATWVPFCQMILKPLLPQPGAAGDCCDSGVGPDTSPY